MAVTATVDTTYKRIYLSGSGTMTVSQLNSAVSTTYVEEISTDVYQIKLQYQLELRTGVTFVIEEDQELQWDLSANLNCIDSQFGSAFEMEAGAIINYEASGGYLGYGYFYGTTSMQGTSAKPIIIKNYYENKLFFREGETHNWDWIEFQYPKSTGSTGLYFYDGSAACVGSFTNIENNNRTNYGYTLRMRSVNLSNVIFDSIISRDCRYGIESVGANFKISNSKFIQQTYYHSLNGNQAGDSYLNSGNSDSPYTFYQSKITFDTCTFEDCYNASSSEIGFYVAYNTVIKLKDCIFQGIEDTMANGAYAYYGTKLLWQGETQFVNVSTKRRWGYSGMHLHVRSLDLTVLDSSGDPLENANVTVRQKDNKEVWNFQTDSNGNILDGFGDLPVFVEKAETSTDVYTQWSDGSGDNVHIITVSHPDYNLIDTREVAFTEDKTIVVQLSNTPTGITTIHGSTLNNVNLY